MRWRDAITAAVLAAACGLASATPCTLVFGQGRNPTLKGGPDWDTLNQQFNAAISQALDAAGRRVMPLTADSVQADPEAAALALLREADRLGCATLAETNVFADEQDTLVLRLRVYPLLPTLGPGGTLTGLRIGAPVFITQREFALKALLRLKLDATGQQLAAEYLQHDRR
ncbi:hypothetical protein [Roseateles sp. BYS87W]|uniref:FlgO domain-containing protein n=1 Tax=Pelomonas baiyunensis TaxID=3299026 RepID=A0ABW7H1K2_9BURK